MKAKILVEENLCWVAYTTKIKDGQPYHGIDCYQPRISKLAVTDWRNNIVFLIFGHTKSNNII